MTTDTAEAESDEAYRIGLAEGRDDAVQEIDIATGGDGVFRACLGAYDPERHVPDAATMQERIVARLTAAIARAEKAEAAYAEAARLAAEKADQLGGDASRTGCAAGGSAGVGPGDAGMPG